MMHSVVQQKILAWRDYYDVPRAFFIKPKPGLLLFFDCPFNELLDEYPSRYSVFSMRASEASQLPDDWRALDAFKLGLVGDVRVSAILFDESGRQNVVVDGLDELVAVAEDLAVKSVRPIGA